MISSKSMFVSCFAFAVASCVTGCGGGSPALAPLPGTPVLLLDGPAHLGDNRAEGQDFPTGDAAAARVCSLVSLPRPTMAYLQVLNVRHTESLGDMVTVNDAPIRLPITLERDPRGLSSNSTTASPIEPVSLAAGPTEVCLVSGLRLNGDLDDFEVDQVVLRVTDIDASDIQVRRNLLTGRPPQTTPPSVPYGYNQQPFPSPVPTYGYAPAWFTTRPAAN